ncbi:MAG: hypothetical protein JRF72_01745 [Deltaproteobacteria bacterium]|jgi:hypothetical protein|nr:hypothetical protein [Deltaproteobacteria bacterium]
MKIIISTTLTLVALSILCMMMPPGADANEYTCTIRGGRQDVYVIVTDMDRDGNPMRQRGELYQGVIKAGESQALKSTFGKIRYSYRLYNQSRSQGRIASDCRGNTIQLP